MTIAEDILNRAITLGNQKSSEASAAAQQALIAAQGVTFMVPPALAPTPVVIEPPVNIPTNANGVDGTLFDSTYNQIITDLSTQFADFFSTYFPLDDQTLQAAQDWYERALTVGGTGINATLEEQLWQRDRDRLIRQAAASEDEAVAKWAAMGFPLPSGQAMASVEQIRRDRDIEIAKSSRDRTIESIRAELENVRLAVVEAVNFRTKAIAAAGEYIRTLALGPQLATQLATAAANAQSQLISAASSYYGARIRVAELNQNRDRDQAQLTQRAGETNVASFDRRTAVNAQVAVGVAQSLGQQAASALNAVNGTAQLIQQLES